MAAVGLEIVTGVMGGGKSYFATELMLQALSEGAQVHTNIELRMEEISARGYAQQVVNLRDVPLREYPKLIRKGDETHPNVLVFDEAARTFSVDEQRGSTKNEDKHAVFDMIMMARRYGLEVWFLAQDERNVDVKLRRMCQFITRCTNTSHIYYFGWLISSVFGIFQRTKYMVRGDRNIPIATTFHRFNKRVASAYNTHDLLGIMTLDNKMVTRKLPKRHDQTVGKVIFCVFACALTFLLITAYHSMRNLYRITGMAQVKQPAHEQVEEDAPDTYTACTYTPAPRKLMVATNRNEVISLGLDYKKSKVVALVPFGNIVYVKTENGKQYTLTPSRL